VGGGGGARGWGGEKGGGGGRGRGGGGGGGGGGEGVFKRGLGLVRKGGLTAWKARDHLAGLLSGKVEASNKRRGGGTWGEGRRKDKGGGS